MTNKWLDPTGYKTDADFRLAYTHAHARMMAFKELIEIVEGAEQRILDIKRRMETATKGFHL